MSEPVETALTSIDAFLSLIHILPVLVDDFDVVSEAYYGRSYMDAPDIDPKIYFTGKPGIKPGQIVKVKIEEVIDYDLIGTVV